MTYEEKLEIVVQAIKEAKQFTRKDCLTKLYFGLENGLSRVGLDMVYDILLQLQDDEKIIKVDKVKSSLGTFDQTVDMKSGSKDYFKIDILDIFDEWYENYLLKHKTSVSNIDYINMLRIYDVVLDINEQIQLTNKTVVTIHLLPSLIRFSALFPADTIGMRDKYCETRWDSLKYLQEQGIIQEFKHNSAFHRWDTNVTVTPASLTKFDDFYRAIQSEYVRRNKEADKKEEVAIDKTATPTTPAKVSYDPKKGVLVVEGKQVKLNKDSFRAKILELLLKDEKSKKKEWSWDEVIEAIEDTKDAELTKENKDKFYPACDGLSKHIALKIGINDLLIFNKSTVQINPKYF